MLLDSQEGNIISLLERWKHKRSFSFDEFKELLVNLRPEVQLLACDIIPEHAEQFKEYIFWQTIKEN